METTIKETLNRPGSKVNKANQPEAGASSVWKENWGQFERDGATYTHRIYTPGYERPITGYSKPQNQMEPANKFDLLKKIVRRLTSGRNNYLKPGCRIEFFHNISDSDNDSYRLFTLYPDRYDPNPQVSHWEWLIQFLNHFHTPTVSSYTLDLSGTGQGTARPALENSPATLQPPTPPANRPMGDPFSKNRPFKDVLALNQYCHSLRQQGYPDYEVKSYTYAMCEKHNW